MPQWLSSVFPLPGAPYPATDWPCSAASSRNRTQVALDLQHLAGKAGMALDGVEPGGLLLVEDLLDPAWRFSGALVRAGVDTQRAAMRVELVDVDDPQAGRRQRS